MLKLHGSHPLDPPNFGETQEITSKNFGETPKNTRKNFGEINYLCLLCREIRI